MNNAFDINAKIQESKSTETVGKEQKNKLFPLMILQSDKERMEQLRIDIAQRQQQLYSQSELVTLGIDLLKKAYPAIDSSVCSHKFKGGKRNGGESIAKTTFYISPDDINFFNNVLFKKVSNDPNYTKRYLFKEILDLVESETAEK